MPTLQGLLPNTLNEPNVTRILYINVAGDYSEKQRNSIRIALHGRIAGLGWESGHTRTAYVYFQRDNNQTYTTLTHQTRAGINTIPNFLTANGVEFEVNHADIQFSLMISLPRDVIAVEPVVQNDGNERQAAQADGNDEPAVGNEGNVEPVDQNDGDGEPALGNEGDERQAVEHEGNEQPVVENEGHEEPMDRAVKPEGPTVRDVKKEEPAVENDGNDGPAANYDTTEHPTTSDVKPEDLTAEINKLEIKKEDNNDEGEQESNVSH